MILVHNTGAKPGVERVNPMTYHREDDRFYIYATLQGAERNPAWCHNLVASPRTTVEVGTGTFDVMGRVLTGAERDESATAAAIPDFDEFQRKTTRIIPVVELRRVDS